MTQTEFCLRAERTDPGHRLVLETSSPYLLGPAVEKETSTLWLQVDCDELLGCPAVDPISNELISCPVSECGNYHQDLLLPSPTLTPQFNLKFQ